MLRGELPRALERVAAYVATPEVRVRFVHYQAIAIAMAIAHHPHPLVILLPPRGPSRRWR